jgi:hypothetical protein
VQPGAIAVDSPGAADDKDDQKPDHNRQEQPDGVSVAQLVTQANP